MPKQFCDLFDESLILKTLIRVSKLGSPWVITSKKMELLTQKTFRGLGIPDSQILPEPEPKNTAAAIAWACRVFQQLGRDQEVLALFPADHLIQNEEAFISALRIAEKSAQGGELVTLGIQPTHPATGYGYIELERADKTPTPVLQRALGFREKPDLQTASEFLKSGRFAWNGGIFVFRVDRMIELLKSHLPQIWLPFSDMKDARAPSEVARVFESVPSLSIDYGVMEKLDGHACVTGDFGWSDVGSWDELASLTAQTSNPMVEVHAKNNFVFSKEYGRTYALVGVDDLLVVDTQDALLICKKGESQTVKDAQAAMAALKVRAATTHQFENRPWGRFDVLKDTEKFKSKVIRVDPGQQLSLQSHTKRAEYWIILNGSPEVVLNDTLLHPKPGEHVYIPVGAKHRMKNPTQEPIEFVEVQVGSYFGEDDITRYQDDYKRV